MSGERVALVTGASGGLGRAIAVRLAAEHGMRVLLLARSREKTESARDEVNRRSGRSDAEIVACDLGSLRSVRETASELAARLPRLDVLVNNAGVLTTKRELTEDGFERQLGVNHLGHFALSGLLFGLLERSEDARLVVVSSGAHKIGRMSYEDPQLERGFTVWGAYGRSKLANVWFVRELARRLPERGTFSANALHPGAVATQLGVDRRTGFGAGVHRLLRPFFLTPERGAETAIHLATSDEVRGRSGGYYYRSREEAPSRRARDAEAARVFWDWSEAQTGVRWPVRS